MKIAVIGSGIWGACSAYFLKKSGADVELYDMWGPGNSRSGSGGASRIIRLAYGNDKIYSELTNKSFKFWEELSKKSERKLYFENGMLWLITQKDNSYIKNSIPVINSLDNEIIELPLRIAKKKYPILNFNGVNEVYLEKKAGILLASRCCKKVVKEFQKIGGLITIGEVKVEENKLNKGNGITINNKKIKADKYIIACGPWNKKILPNFFNKISYVSRQEVYFFSIPNNNNDNYKIKNMPCWMDLNENSPTYYGMPFHLNKGFKVAYDERSTLFDPDKSDRIPLPKLIKRTKKYIYKRFPGLKNLPITESKVCQYENSIDGNFIIEKHSLSNNVLIMGGSSGHGFKMGPGIGEFVKDVILKNKKIPSFFSRSRLINNKNLSQYYNSQIKYESKKRFFN